MDDEAKRHIAELEGRVAVLEEQRDSFPWAALERVVWGEQDDSDYEELEAWLLLNAPKEEEPHP